MNSAEEISEQQKRRDATRDLLRASGKFINVSIDVIRQGRIHESKRADTIIIYAEKDLAQDVPQDSSINTPDIAAVELNTLIDWLSSSPSSSIDYGLLAVGLATKHSDSLLEQVQFRGDGGATGRLYLYTLSRLLGVVANCYTGASEVAQELVRFRFGPSLHALLDGSSAAGHAQYDCQQIVIDAEEQFEDMDQSVKRVYFLTLSLILRRAAERARRS